MGKSKVVYNDETLIDLSGDTVTEENLAEGVTAHNANGDPIVGTMTSALVDSGQCGDDVYWELYKNGLLVLSGSGATSEHGGKVSPFDGRTDIADVVIKEGVTTIGSHLFGNCSVENIVIPNSVESIGEYAFEYCINLKSVTIPSGCTTIGSKAFVVCFNLSRVVIPDIVTNIGDAAFLETSGEYAQLEVLYTGTKEQWDNITIGEYNDRLFNGILHCEYEENTNADTLDGWHLNIISDGSDPENITEPTITLVYTEG